MSGEWKLSADRPDSVAVIRSGRCCRLDEGCLRQAGLACESEHRRVVDAVRPLGLEATAAEPNLSPQVVSTGLGHLILPLRSVEDLSQITPDFAALPALLEPRGAFGVYAACYEPANGTARARFFARDRGIGEDPATGSAAGPLCAYLHRYAGCSAVEITQGVEMGRPSLLRAETVADRVRVSGDVVVLIDGTVTL